MIIDHSLTEPSPFDLANSGFFSQRATKKFIEGLKSINDFVYVDDENCLSLLHLTAGLDSEHREDIIELLIENHADVNRRGKSENIGGVRPIHLAAMWGYDLTVKLLLYHGADASLRDENNLSPVDYATIFDNYLCISLLLRYGRLNTSAKAWSDIMDSSLVSRRDESIDESCLYTTALDFGGDEQKKGISEQSDYDNTYFLSDGDNNDSFEQTDDFDPLEGLDESQVNHNLELENQRLRLELKRLGRNPGPITDTTKRLYAKLLTRLAKEDKELVYSPRTKFNSELNGFSNELNSIITGKFSIKQALDLEKELIRVSGTKDYHGPKQFFNYILIDPRISENLPEQAMEVSDSDTSGNKLSPIGVAKDQGDHKSSQHAMRKLNRKFNPKLFTKFIESIFYIGKGQKKRDLMHLYDALADRGSITQAKIERIRSIWEDGFGVVSLHIFHNITSKEALTREAIMIETMGLSNLTNLLRGTIQFKLGWNEHKRRQLGSLLLHRAYVQFLNEGERQLRRGDLKVEIS